MKAGELIAAFNEYVTSNPDNRHNKYLSFRNKEKMIKPLEDILWDKVEQQKEEITEKVKQFWGGTKEPSSRSIELAWIGLAYCYEFGVVKNLIPRNPFKNLLPRKPRTGSHLD